LNPADSLSYSGPLKGTTLTRGVTEKRAGRKVVEFQCPCGLCGLFHLILGLIALLFGMGHVSVPVWALGSFPPGRPEVPGEWLQRSVSVPVWALGSFPRGEPHRGLLRLPGQVSVPVWALGSFPRRASRPTSQWPKRFSARVGSGVFSTKRMKRNRTLMFVVVSIPRSRVRQVK
jgi:hypothetical protein